MPNMSYCMFENTANDLEEANSMLDEIVDKMEEDEDA